MAELSDAQHQSLIADAWFSSVPSQVRDEVIRAGRLVRLRRREVLYRKGDRASGWYGIVQGAVKVSSVSLAGRELALTILESGSWFGELALLDGLPRVQEASAYEDSELLAVSPADFQDLLVRFPVLTRKFLILQCLRMRLLIAAVEEWGAESLEVRLRSRLCALASSCGKPHKDGVELQLHLPQAALADLTGVSRQRINHTLKVWAGKGWVTNHYGKLVLGREFLAMAPESPI